MNNTNSEPEESSKTCLPWNLWFRQADGGDIQAEYKIYDAATPLIDKISRVPYFRSRLGCEEIRSIAYYALVKLVRQHGELPADNVIPFYLKKTLRNALFYCIRQQENRLSHEQPAADFTEAGKDGDVDEGNGIIETVADDKATSPEEQYEHTELRCRVRDAVSQLPEEEKHMIHGLYFQNKGMKEIAEELHCTYQNAYVMRRKAYKHLHKLLEPCKANA